MDEAQAALALAVLGNLSTAGLLWYRTRKAKQQVVVTGDQIDVDQRRLVTTMAARLLDTQGQIMDLIREKAGAVERDKNQAAQIADLKTELTEVKALLQKAYGEITRQSEQLARVVDKFMSGDKAGGVAIANEGPAEAPVVTQHSVDQVAAAPSPQPGSPS